MSEKQYKIIFEELDKLSEEPEIWLGVDELIEELSRCKEHEDIRALREIVLEIQAPARTYFTST